MNGVDDGAATVALTQAFNFYGTAYTSLRVSSNGYISTLAGDSGGDLSNDSPLPVTPSTGGGARIYPYHDDLVVDATGQVYHQFFATSPVNNISGGTEPCTIIQWHNMRQFGGSVSTGEGFEVILFHTSGEIRFQYSAVVNLTGASATLGIQNDGATIGLMYGSNTAGLATSTRAISLYAPPAAPAITSTAPATAAVGFLYTYTVTATGSPAPTFSINPNPATQGSGWLTWNGTDTLSGTPGAGDVGNFPTLTITATNGVSPDATQVINIVVSQPAPEIDVTDPGATSIPNNQAFTLYGLYVGGPDISDTLTITNTGTAVLNVTAINTTNTNCTVTVTPNNALPWALALGGGFDTFDIDITPVTAGAFSGSVSIVNNDGDENPFVITFSGNTQANNEPEIALHRQPADTDIANNSTVNETNTGLASFNRVFSIRNEGSNTLTLTGPPVVVVTAESNVVVTITQPASLTIAGASGGANSEDFTLSIAPIAAGAFSFTVTILSNDNDEGTFVFNYTGHTTTPSGGGGGGGGGGKDGCSTSNGSSGWLVLFAALAGLGLALRLRRSRA